jgi:hypothetical protein
MNRGNNMNSQAVIRGLLAATIYALSTTASALTLGQSPVTEVGDLDIFVHVSTKNELSNSNPTTEKNWIESVLGFSVNYLAHGNNVPISATNEDPTAFAWKLVTSNSDYFLVKNAGYWAIFQNLAEQFYAVVDADSGLLPDKMNFGNATISHYGVVKGGGGGTNPPSEIVPIPAPFALIGIGLAGLGWIRRSKV